MDPCRTGSRWVVLNPTARYRRREIQKVLAQLEELADSPEFREFVAREFPQHAEEWNDPVERRTFLKLMGASLALAGLSGCVFQPPEKIVPYVKQPEEEVPGKALVLRDRFFAGRHRHAVAGAQQRRPPDQSRRKSRSSEQPQQRSQDRGSSATDIFSQASILSLYDPDRSQTPLYREETRTWSTFVGEIRTALDEQRPEARRGHSFSD